MRVIHVISGLSTGGAERALFNLLSGGLGEAGETLVLSLTDEGTFAEPIRELGVTVLTLNMRGSFPRPAALKRLRKIVRGFQPDLIQGWMYHGNLAVSIAGLLATNKPKIIWNIRHSLYSLKAEKKMTRQVIRANRCLSVKADSIIYNSHLSQLQHETFGFAGEKARVIANGFDTEVLKANSEKRNSMRKALGIESDAHVVGHVARFHPMKGHVGFLQAAVKVLETRPNVIFLLAGRDVNLSNPSLSGIVPKAMEKQFRFVGERRDVHDVMQVMDLFCISSEWGEAFPNVLAEVMCLQIPCVATDVGDSSAIVGTCGRVVPIGQPLALANEILNLLSLPDTEKKELGKLARQRIKANYALPNIVQQYDDFYRYLTLQKT